jgi:hypothetical protein
MITLSSSATIDYSLYLQYYLIIIITIIIIIKGIKHMKGQKR